GNPRGRRRGESRRSYQDRLPELPAGQTRMRLAVSRVEVGRRGARAGSGIDHTILKSGVIYGRGDHLLDHVSRALYTFPVFPLVGLRPTQLRPVYVGDVVRLARSALTDPRLSRRTVAVLGPEELAAGDAIRRIAAAVGREVPVVPAPVWVHRILAWIFERTMTIP